jgi:hypothetical protein
MKELDSKSQSDTADEQSRWRTVTMPFDVPLMSVCRTVICKLPQKFDFHAAIQIINRVRIIPQLPSGALVYAGQPLDVTVTIEACFHWGGSKEDLESKHMMRYDVLSDMDSGWLISGPKRGEYMAWVSGQIYLRMSFQ